MKKYTFEDIKKEGLLLFEYIRGSHMYHLNTPESDIDTGGIFLAPSEQLLGLGFDYQEQIADEKNDNVWMELNKFMKLLLTSNPTVLEALFVPENCIIGEIHPIMQELIKHRDMFVTKECFKPLGGYALQQISKARGLNKKIVNPVTERLKPLDFAYTTYRQGSTKINNWLEYRSLKQQYCGLVHIPNMHDTYGVYYDWGSHFRDENITIDDIWEALNTNCLNEQFSNMSVFIITHNKLDGSINTYGKLFEWFEKQKPIGYKGMIGEDGLSNELRLSSVSKGEIPICHLTYNQSGYTKHCKDYKDYKDWEKNRNPIRYESNLDKNYDSKNMMHCMRLMTMCTEIAKGEGFNVARTKDIDFLLDIKKHKYEYDELMKIVDSKKEEMETAMEESTIPESIDVEFVNNLLLQVRKKQIKLLDNEK